MVRLERIELSRPLWKSGVLPLNYSRDHDGRWLCVGRGVKHAFYAGLCCRTFCCGTGLRGIEGVRVGEIRANCPDGAAGPFSPTAN